MLDNFWLIPLGLFAGAYGALIGAGGGFILVPALLILFPNEAPEIVTSISLMVVFLNALSGTIAYARSNRIDYKIGMIFSLATMPGAVLGALATTAVSRERFNLLFGFLLLAIAAVLVISPGKESATRIAQSSYRSSLRSLNLATLITGALVSTGFGFLSSFLGIGGGILYVPALVYLLRVPVHVATATSLFVLMITAFTGSATHFVTGLFHADAGRAVALSIGAVVGAQAGVILSQKIHGEWIIRSLALALGLVGIRLLSQSWW
jgi:uncharacterized membrane protein YfcA